MNSAGVRFAVLAGLLALASHARAGSVTVSGLVDGDNGSSLAVDGSLWLMPSWLVSAGVGHSESSLDANTLAGTSVRASTHVLLGDFAVGGSYNRWKDSGDLTSSLLQGEVGWNADSGFALAALVASRELQINYTITVLGETRARDVHFDGTGLGADVSWYGDSWMAGARFMHYDYGTSMQRVRNALNSPDTLQFPRLQLLVDSVATRLVGAAELEWSATVGRQFARTSLHGDWFMQRDALTGDDIHSLGLTLGYRAGKHFELAFTAGISDAESGTVPYGGLVVTVRSTE